MNKERKKIGGFTLIEIYTVMAITAILISIAGLTTKARNENLALSIQHEKMRSLFVRAKSLAINSVNPPEAKVGDYFCGYGVKVDPVKREMFVFADKGLCEGSFVDLANREYKETDGDARLTSSIDVFREDSGIGFSCFLSRSSSVPEIDFLPESCGKDFVFIPPDPKVFINKKDAFNEYVIGVYSKRTPSKIRQVIINKAGLIDAI